MSNFANRVHQNYHLGLPMTGRWTEILNTDADSYTGSGVGNLGGVDAVDEPHHGLSASTTLTLPPLATVWLRHGPA